MKPDIFAVAIFLVLSVGPAVIDPASVAGRHLSSQSNVAVTNSVSYKGVSFAFDPSLASEVRPETIAASVEGKPSDIWPEHVGFKFVGYPPLNKLPGNDPQIRVFSVARFREAFQIATKEYAKSLADPSKAEDWTFDFDDEVRILKSLLARKPAKANLSWFLARARGEQGCSAATMPFLPMWEACQAFVARPRYVKFRNGEGVFFLTQMDTETSRVTNMGLEYAFQGITNDGKFYVYAEFSVAAPFLPKGDEPSVEAWNLKNYLLSHKSPQYQNYVRPIVFKLEALRSDQFKPNLTLLEALMNSLEVQNK